MSALHHPLPPSRNLLLAARLKQLLQWHDVRARLPHPALHAAVGVGMIAAVALAVPVVCVSAMLNVEPRVAVPLAASAALPVGAAAGWVHAVWRVRRQRVIARSGLEAKIVQFLREFPETVAAWGGPTRLCDPKFVRLMVRHLEPLGRDSSGRVPVEADLLFGLVAPIPVLGG